MISKLLFLTLLFLFFRIGIPSYLGAIEENPSLKYFQQYEPQIFRFWSLLTEEEQNAFESQLHQIDLHILEKQKQTLQEPSPLAANSFEPFDDFMFSGNLNHQLIGQQLIEQGRLGCLLLAGGEGSRLQYEKPKGTYPISVIKNKSLFQLCAEKVRAASQKAKRPLNLAIMTSPDNDKETRLFFKHNDFFGLNPSQVSFFSQGILPYLDSNGKLFLRHPWQITCGADGNGHSLLCFAQSGILDRWIQEGVEYLHIILVDNPLADPFDAELLGFHHQQGADISLKCTEKSRPEEKVGVLVKQHDHCRVVEYSEMPDREKNERRQDGRLKHCCANLSLFCFSLSFIQDIVSTGKSLPLHKAWKAASYLDEQGVSQLSKHPIAWKFETFIFDWLMYAQKVAALIYPREECFAPLKNAEGADSPDTVRNALQQADRRIIQSITGLAPPDFPFELAPDFYYPTSELRAKWWGKKVITSYVEP